MPPGSNILDGTTLVKGERDTDWGTLGGAQLGTGESILESGSSNCERTVKCFWLLRSIDLGHSVALSGANCLIVNKLPKTN
ncbi:unnamed protein product [Clavelina lepadiformis]|uniref:Uncharacterized protein n=1 Tax=Clavelina lepadiformis TaxID=159417 RepID=A0ABP0F5Y5_CLALP